MIGGLLSPSNAAGETSTSGVGMCSNSIEVYDSNTDVWSTAVPNMAFDRMSPMCAVIDGYLYVVGGDRYGLQVRRFRDMRS